MWTGQKLLHVIFSCKMLQIADGHNSGHTELTAAGRERRRAAANCDEDIMLVTIAGFRQM